MIKLVSLIPKKYLCESSIIDAHEDFFERRSKAFEEIINAFRTSKPGNQFHWPLISANKLQKIWLDMGKTGIVRDEKGMWNIREQILTNIAMLSASTELLGHTQSDPNQTLEDMEIPPLTPEEDERLGDCLTHSDGSWLLSDYGLPKLEHLYLDLFMADTAENMLYAADKILNVVHQRSDLASLFVQGGTHTLLKIANQGGYVEPDN